MTTEDDFQAALDAHPDDWQTRLVFADWLQERGDPRAEGYRALGALRRRGLPDLEYACWFDAHEQRGGDDKASDLPRDWFRLIEGGNRDLYVSSAAAFPTRRAADDAAARAFGQLPPSRRTELLNPEGVRS